MAARHRRQRGISLIEVLIASAVLSFAVAAICQAVVAGQQQTYEALHDLRGMSLAEALVEEVQALPYADPEGVEAAGPDAGETDRGLFDNSDDFHGFTETVGNVADAGGVAYGAGFAPFNRAATATYGTVAVAELGGAVSGLTVVVTVTDDRGQAWTATRFIPEPAAE